MKEQEAPSLAGPSEFGTSVTVAVTPDVITQDGASQSVVTATVRGSRGEPLANLPLRAEIRVDGVVVDFGSLSARNIVTSNSGEARVVYTAPPALGGPAVDSNTMVDIGITPLGTDANASVTRFASIRLVPRGTIVVPSTLQARMTVNPTAATQGQTVVFDGAASSPAAQIALVHVELR